MLNESIVMRIDADNMEDVAHESSLDGQIQRTGAQKTGRDIDFQEVGAAVSIQYNIASKQLEAIVLEAYALREQRCQFRLGGNKRLDNNVVDALEDGLGLSRAFSLCKPLAKGCKRPLETFRLPRVILLVFILLHGLVDVILLKGFTSVRITIFLCGVGAQAGDSR